VSSDFSVEAGGDFDKEFWVGGKLQIFLFKPTCKKRLRRTPSRWRTCNVKRFKIEYVIDSLFDDTFY